VGIEESILTKCNEVPVAFGSFSRLYDTAAFGSRTAAITVLLGRVRRVVNMPRPIPSNNLW
jgi:hypothetical protein